MSHFSAMLRWMNFCLLNHFCLKVSAILKYNLRRAIFPKKIPYCASLCDVLLCQSINLHLHQICGHGACSVACQNTKCTMTKFFSSDLRGPKLKCTLDTAEPQATRGASLSSLYLNSPKNAFSTKLNPFLYMGTRKQDILWRSPSLCNV